MTNLIEEINQTVRYTWRGLLIVTLGYLESFTTINPTKKLNKIYINITHEKLDEDGIFGISEL